MFGGGRRTLFSKNQPAAQGAANPALATSTDPTAQAAQPQLPDSALAGDGAPSQFDAIAAAVQVAAGIPQRKKAQLELEEQQRREKERLEAEERRRQRRIAADNERVERERAAAAAAIAKQQRKSPHHSPVKSKSHRVAPAASAVPTAPAPAQGQHSDTRASKHQHLAQSAATAGFRAAPHRAKTKSKHTDTTGGGGGGGDAVDDNPFAYKGVSDEDNDTPKRAEQVGWRMKSRDDPESNPGKAHAPPPRAVPANDEDQDGLAGLQRSQRMPAVGSTDAAAAGRRPGGSSSSKRARSSGTDDRAVGTSGKVTHGEKQAAVHGSTSKSKSKPAAVLSEAPQSHSKAATKTATKSSAASKGRRMDVVISDDDEDDIIVAAAKAKVSKKKGAASTGDNTNNTGGSGNAGLISGGYDAKNLGLEDDPLADFDADAELARVPERPHSSQKGHTANGENRQQDAHGGAPLLTPREQVFCMDDVERAAAAPAAVNYGGPPSGRIDGRDTAHPPRSANDGGAAFTMSGQQVGAAQQQLDFVVAASGGITATPRARPPDCMALRGLTPAVADKSAFASACASPGHGHGETTTATGPTASASAEASVSASTAAERGKVQALLRSLLFNTPSMLPKQNPNRSIVPLLNNGVECPFMHPAEPTVNRALLGGALQAFNTAPQLGGAGGAAGGGGGLPGLGQSLAVGGGGGDGNQQRLPFAAPGSAAPKLKLDTVSDADHAASLLKIPLLSDAQLTIVQETMEKFAPQQSTAPSTHLPEAHAHGKSAPAAASLAARSGSGSGSGGAGGESGGSAQQQHFSRQLQQLLLWLLPPEVVPPMVPATATPLLTPGVARQAAVPNPAAVGQALVQPFVAVLFVAPHPVFGLGIGGAELAKATESLTGVQQSVARSISRTLAIGVGSSVGGTPNSLLGRPPAGAASASTSTVSQQQQQQQQRSDENHFVDIVSQKVLVDQYLPWLLAELFAETQSEVWDALRASEDANASVLPPEIKKAIAQEVETLKSGEASASVSNSAVASASVARRSSSGAGPTSTAVSELNSIVGRTSDGGRLSMTKLQSRRLSTKERSDQSDLIAALGGPPQTRDETQAPAGMLPPAGGQDASLLGGGGGRGFSAISGFSAEESTASAMAFNMKRQRDGTGDILLGHVGGLGQRRSTSLGSRSTSVSISPGRDGRSPQAPASNNGNQRPQVIHLKRSASAATRTAASGYSRSIAAQTAGAGNGGISQHLPALKGTDEWYAGVPFGIDVGGQKRGAVPEDPSTNGPNRRSASRGRNAGGKPTPSGQSKATTSQQASSGEVQAFQQLGEIGGMAPRVKYVSAATTTDFERRLEAISSAVTEILDADLEQQRSWFRYLETCCPALCDALVEMMTVPVVSSTSTPTSSAQQHAQPQSGASSSSSATAARSAATAGQRQSQPPLHVQPQRHREVNEEMKKALLNAAPFPLLRGVVVVADPSVSATSAGDARTRLRIIAAAQQAASAFAVTNAPSSHPLSNQSHQRVPGYGSPMPALGAAGGAAGGGQGWQQQRTQRPTAYSSIAVKRATASLPVVPPPDLEQLVSSSAPHQGGNPSTPHASAAAPPRTSTSAQGPANTEATATTHVPAASQSAKGNGPKTSTLVPVAETYDRSDERYDVLPMTLLLGEDPAVEVGRQRERDNIEKARKLEAATSGATATGQGQGKHGDKRGTASNNTGTIHPSVFGGSGLLGGSGSVGIGTGTLAGLGLKQGGGGNVCGGATHIVNSVTIAPRMLL